MLNKFKKALIYANQYGWLALLSLILASIRRARHPFAKISITDRYDELIAPPFGNTIDTELVSPMTINWFIPPVGKGLGGHLNLFRFIRNLEDLSIPQKQ